MVVFFTVMVSNTSLCLQSQFLMLELQVPVAQQEEDSGIIQILEFHSLLPYPLQLSPVLALPTQLHL